MSRFLIALTIAALSACSRYVSLPSYGIVPDFVLTDQTGLEFRSSERLNGKVWVANFIFTNCAGPCPRMSGQMRQVRDAIKSPDVRLVSFTVDPARDTPQVLAAYGQRFAADPTQWHFLTGTQGELHRLCRNGFLLGDVDGRLEHSTRFVLVDRHSRIRGFYDTSDQANVRTLIKNLAELARSSA